MKTRMMTFSFYFFLSLSQFTNSTRMPCLRQIDPVYLVTRYTKSNDNVKKRPTHAEPTNGYVLIGIQRARRGLFALSTA